MRNHNVWDTCFFHPYQYYPIIVIIIIIIELRTKLYIKWILDLAVAHMLLSPASLFIIDIFIIRKIIIVSCKART